MFSAERCWHFTILPTILDERWWDSRLQRIILWCVLKVCRRTCQFYGVFWRQGLPSAVNYEIDFSEYPTVWRKTYGFEGCSGGGGLPTILIGRYWHLALLPMIFDGTCWNSGFQHSILRCVLSIWRKKYQSYAMVWGQACFANVIFLNFRTYCEKPMVMGGRRANRRRNNSLQALRSGERHEKKPK